MEQNTNMTGRQTNIPPAIWFLGIGLVIALIAVFVFNVAVSTVFYYGLLALMVGSHFFMHGSHSGHGGSAGHQHDSTPNASESDKPGTNQHSDHNGGCH